MESALIHKILLQKAKESQYTKIEIEEINRQYENILIEFYLRRESLQKMSQVEISEEKLKEIFEQNKSRYQIETQVEIDTIFMKDETKITEVLKTINTRNFEKYKKEYDEKEVEELSRKVPLSLLHPNMTEAILQQKKTGIIKKIVKIEDGFHIVFLKEKEEMHQATYEEAKKTLIQEVEQKIFQDFYQDTIHRILNEEQELKEKDELRRVEEK